MKLSKTISVLVAAGMIACLGAGCNKPTNKDTGSSSMATGSDSSVSTGSTDVSTASGTSAVSGSVASGKTNNPSATAPTSTAPHHVTIVNTASRLPGIQQRLQDLSKIDLKGRTVNIGCWYAFQVWPGTDETGKRQVSLNQSIEKTANCKLNPTWVNNGSDPTIKTSILSGKPKVDFFIAQGAGRLYDYYSSGCLANLEQFSAIHKSDTTKYMPDDLGVINGKTYGLVPTTFGWLERNYNTAFMCDFSVTTKAGHPYTEIYNWIKSGQWNWSNFEKVCKDVMAKVPGTYGLDEHGSARYNFNMDYTFYQSMLWADNCDWVGKKNNKFIFTGGTGNAMKVLNQYAAWANPNTGFIRYDKDKDIYTNFFAQKTAFLADIYLESTQQIGSTTQSNGVIQFPMGPDCKKYVSRGVQNHWIVIPKGVKDAQQIAAVYEAYCTPLFSKSESRNQCLIETERDNTLKESIDQNLAIFDDPDDAKCSYSLYGSAANLDIAQTTSSQPGWFDYVHKIALGQMTAQQAVSTFTNRCNSVLSTTFN